MLIRVLIAIGLCWSGCVTLVVAAYDQSVNDVFGPLQESPMSVDRMDIFYFDQADVRTKALAKYMYEMEPLVVKKLNVFDAEGHLEELIIELEKSAQTNAILVVQLKTAEQSKPVQAIAQKYQRPLILLLSQYRELLQPSYDQAYFVAPSPDALGRAQAKLLIDYFKEFRTDFNFDGVINLVMITGKYKDPISFGIAHGCLETLKKNNVRYRVVGLNQTDGSAQEAFEAMNQSIDRNDLSNIDAVICNSDTIAMAAVEAMRRFGYNGFGSYRLIPVVGVGNTQAVQKYMQYGNILGTVGVEELHRAQAIVSLANSLQKGVKPDIVSHSTVDGQQVSLEVKQYLANTKYHLIDPFKHQALKAKEAQLAQGSARKTAESQSMALVQSQHQPLQLKQLNQNPAQFRTQSCPEKIYKYWPLYQKAYQPPVYMLPNTWLISNGIAQKNMQLSSQQYQCQEPHYLHPQYKQPRYQRPEYERPEYTRPDYVKPQYSLPEYQKPEYVQPQYQQPHYKVPEY